MSFGNGNEARIVQSQPSDVTEHRNGRRNR